MTGGLVFSPTAPLDEASRDEQDLVARLVRADPAAVGEVYDQHHRAVRAFASRLVGDAAAAEDLVHEVFVTLPRAMRGYRFESSLRCSLFRKWHQRKSFVSTCGAVMTSGPTSASSRACTTPSIQSCR